MDSIKTCTYDNPATMCREAWRDKRLIAHITADFLFQKPTICPRFVIHMGLNVGDWKEGQKIGDPEAIGEEYG